jgi:hypothetical protein
MGLFNKVIKTLAKGWKMLCNLTKKLAAIIITGLVVVAKVIGKFFTFLTQWLDKAIDFVEKTYNVTVIAVQTFIKKVNDEYQELSYNYYQQGNQFLRDTVVKQSYISADEVPEDIRRLAEGMSNDQMKEITDITAEKQEYALDMCPA